MSVADMSERLAPDNAAPLEGDAAVAAGGAAVVVVGDYKSTASTDARCKAAALMYTAAFDCTRRSAAAPARHSEWGTDYRQRGLKTASRSSSIL